MNNRTLRRVYLVTYSQADKLKFPSRQHFGKAVEEALNSGTSKVKATYWACCLENHQDGGEHFHVSIKLTGPKRWLPAKKYPIEDEMMASRWKVFKFFHQIPLKDQREMVSCSICFSRLILS